MAFDIIKNNLLILFLASFCLGLDKGGLKTLLVLCMYFLTQAIDAKYMLAVLAPIMFISDLIPIYIYKDSINLKPIFAFLPFMILGIILGGIGGKYLNEQYFTIILASFILMMAIMMSYSFIKNTKSKEIKPFSFPLRIILGFISGISAISNAAAAITNMYFFKETKTKEEFIGTCSSLFFVVNGIKLLMFIFIWNTITLDTLLITISLIPGMFIGTYVATKFIKIMPQKIFQIIIICSVYYVGIMLFIQNLTC